MTSRVDRIEAFPLSFALDQPYGSARGMVSARTATLVKLTTTDGIVGWGECFGLPAAVVPLVEDMGARLTDCPLDGIEVFAARAMQSTYHNGIGGLHVCALSGIDIALWDAWGKSLGFSVARLLGGRARNKVKAYASTGYVTPSHSLEAFREEIAAALAEGFTAVKVKLGLGVEEDRRRAEAARELIGDDKELMVDLNSNCTSDVAARLIDSLRDLDLYWVEEPVPPEDVSGYRRMRDCGVRIAGGEALFTRFGFRDVISERLVDVAQPDVAKCGGLSEAKAIAHLARTWNVSVSPHHWGGAVSQAATLQFLAALPDYPHVDNPPESVWFEFDRAPNGLRDEVGVEPVRATASEVVIPDAPGLGIEVDEDTVERLRLDRRPK